jgi:hypothetical protein
MVLELGLCKQDKTYVKTFFSITSQAKEAFRPAFVSAWKPQAFGERKFDQLLANEVCANPSSMNVSQLLANDECANSSPKGCVPASC